MPGARLPLPGDRRPGDRGRRARGLPRRDPGADHRPYRPDRAAAVGGGVPGPHRWPGAHHRARGSPRRLARRPVQPRHQGRRSARAPGPRGPPAQGRRPIVSGIVLRCPHRRRPPAVRAVGVHRARTARGGRAPAVVVLPARRGPGARQRRLRAGPAAPGRPGPGRRAVRRRRARPRPAGARVDRRHPGGDRDHAGSRRGRHHDRTPGHAARDAREARPVECPVSERANSPPGFGERLRTWRPPRPPLPEHLAAIIKPDDPEWFARELAIAAAPPWNVWRFMLRNFSWLVSSFGRVEVSGSIPEELRTGPLLLAANHIGDFDPFVIAVALHKLGVIPRIMATGGIISAPVAGPLLERTGAIRVERGTELARHAVRITEIALVQGGHVVAYPEGRVGLAVDGWPERGRTGMARMALGLGVPVIPVSQWGAHEVLQYGNDWGKLRTLLRAVVRRPALRVHVGPPVRLDDLRMGRVGDANRARYRIAAAIPGAFVPRRAAEAERSHSAARPRPTTAVAAYPGGAVPDDVP